MTRVGIITQARTGSTRLPGKVLLEVGGKTLLEHHLTRLLGSGLPVYVATTTDPADDPIVEIAERLGCGTYRGSEGDVLARFYDTAAAFGLDVTVRVTSDCPLIDGALIASAVQQYVAAEDPWLYLSNTQMRTFPRGFDFEVFSADALVDAHQHASAQPQREHVTPYLYFNASGRMHLRNIAWLEDKSSYRITVDTIEDLQLIRALVERHGAARKTCAEIIRILDLNPDLARVNQLIEQKKLGD